MEPGRPRRLRAAAPGGRGAVRGQAKGESYMRAGGRGRGLLLPALPLRAGRPPAPVLARPAQGAPLHRGRLEEDGHVRRHGRWSASWRSTTRASTRTAPPTASTSRARATPTARACPTRSRCGSSASTSPTASATASRRARTAPAGCAWSRCWRRCSSPWTRAAVLSPSDRAPGLLLGDGVQVPRVIQLGGNVVIHAGTVLGHGVRIQDGGGDRQAAGAGAAVHRGDGRRRAADRARTTAPRCAPARSWWPAPAWAPARWSATRPRCASAR